eukprot:gnl/Dysnectes_brevis/2264_a2653_1352.p1 GENE.gnl/Dysnectes_brevis/2264_a2653_1352~~gnl/Dysnectes_brevis/2264_a2653_1352.p1  ORF type:complete len:201 (-),score=0.67 gnl/Dysnectes_brevis/2264_a2653_1352:32-634(-)
MELEVEIKYRIQGSTAFAALLDSLNHESEFIRQDDQTNTYFSDSKGLISSNKIGIRLRDTSDESTLTVKSDYMILHGVARANEWETAITKEQYKQCLLNPSTTLIEQARFLVSEDETHIIHQLSDLSPLLTTTTIRRHYRFKGLHLEIDHVTCKDQELFELECETMDPASAETLLKDFLRSHSIPFTNSPCAKLAWAYNI